jgi:hypothetical protein
MFGARSELKVLLQVLQQIQSMQDSELRSWYAENKDMVSLDFMLWMTNRLIAAEIPVILDW